VRSAIIREERKMGNTTEDYRGFYVSELIYKTSIHTKNTLLEEKVLYRTLKGGSIHS